MEPLAHTLGISPLGECAGRIPLGDIVTLGGIGPRGAQDDTAILEDDDTAVLENGVDFLDFISEQAAVSCGAIHVRCFCSRVSCAGMAELIWDGKYDEHGHKRAPVRIELPFQTVETVNESVQERQRTLELSSSGHDPEWRNRLIWATRSTSCPRSCPSSPARWI